MPSLPQQPIVNRNEATAPVKVMGTDLFQSGSKDYIVFVDQFSGYPWCKKLSSTTSGAIIEVMRELFAEVGNPEWLIRDNGPQLASTETSRFLEGRGIQSDPSSPYYPQSNGLSEAAVKSVKLLWASHPYKPTAPTRQNRAQLGGSHQGRCRKEEEPLRGICKALIQSAERL